MENPEPQVCVLNLKHSVTASHRYLNSMFFETNFLLIPYFLNNSRHTSTIVTKFKKLTKQRCVSYTY